MRAVRDIKKNTPQLNDDESDDFADESEKDEVEELVHRYTPKQEDLAQEVVSENPLAEMNEQESATRENLLNMSPAKNMPPQPEPAFKKVDVQEILLRTTKKWYIISTMSDVRFAWDCCVILINIMNSVLLPLTIAFKDEDWEPNTFDVV